MVNNRAQEVQKQKQTKKTKKNQKARGVIIWHRMVNKTYLESKYMV